MGEEEEGAEKEKPGVAAKQTEKAAGSTKSSLSKETLVDQLKAVSITDSVYPPGRKQVMHWHASRVNALCCHGPFVISGGEEAVLVLWHVEMDKEQFLPRLYGAINHLVVPNLDLLDA